MNTLKYILDKYQIDPIQESPIKWPYRRDELARLFYELGFTKGAEIGVDRGLYSHALCSANPDLKLYCIDPWKVYNKYDDIKEENKFARNLEHTKRMLEGFDCEIIQRSSMGAITNFKPESLDFVYIDGNHRYEYVLEDLRGWSKIVKKGGIVSGHDYRAKSRKYKNPNAGVGMAIDQFMEENDIKPFFWMIEKNDSIWFYVKK